MRRHLDCQDCILCCHFGCSRFKNYKIFKARSAFLARFGLKTTIPYFSSWKINWCTIGVGSDSYFTPYRRMKSELYSSTVVHESLLSSEWLIVSSSSISLPGNKSHYFLNEQRIFVCLSVQITSKTALTMTQDRAFSGQEKRFSLVPQLKNPKSREMLRENPSSRAELACLSTIYYKAWYTSS